MNNLRKIITALFFNALVFVSFSADSHTAEKCGTMQHLERTIADNPQIAKNMAAIESHRTQIKNLAEKARSQGSNLITIPVVFHVVYQTAQQNISDAQLLSQLDVLNEDFRRMNADASNTPSIFSGVAADIEIEFCLAQRDPDGIPTSGIIRHETNVNEFSTDDGVKFNSSGGADAWPTDQYLNFWVCNLFTGLLGYAQFPGGDVLTDGVVVDFSYTGRVGTIANGTSGRTATHEVGHWLDLRHIWGDGPCGNSDFVNDTPDASGSTFGCPNTNTCVDPITTQMPADWPDMVQNYMDYSNDDCMNLFTLGQKERMRSVFEPGGWRQNLLNSTGCLPAILADNDVQLIEMIYPESETITCDNTFSPAIRIRNFGNNNLTELTISVDLDGSNVVGMNWTGNLGQFDYETIVLPQITTTNGTHDITFSATAPNGFVDGNPADNSTSATINVGDIVGDILPVSESFETANFPPTGFSITNFDNFYSWEETDATARTGNTSIFINNYDYAGAGEYDDIDIPGVDLSQYGNAEIYFYTQYAVRTPASTPGASSDTLAVLISTDCGVTFTELYRKEGVFLANTVEQGPYVPAASSNWKAHSIDLSAYNFSNDAYIKIRNINGFENNLYVDDINVIGTPLNTNTQDLADFNAVKLFPNPAKELLNVNVSELDGETDINIVAANGALIKHINNIQQSTLNIDVADFAEGVYYLQVISKEKVTTKKFVKIASR